MDPILFDTHDHEDSHRMVQLTVTQGHQVKDLRAKMYQGDCTLVCTREDAPPQSFKLSANEMDLLCEQWASFKAARVAFLEAEKQSEREQVEEAFRLAREYGIVIEGAPHSGSYVVRWNPNAIAYTRGRLNDFQLLEVIKQMIEELLAVS